jgi:hypothetical protein
LSTFLAFNRGQILFSWTEDDVCDWLQSFGENYVVYGDSFRKDHVDGFRLWRCVNHKELIDYGVNNENHRQRILDGIEKLKQNLRNKS